MPGNDAAFDFSRRINGQGAFYGEFAVEFAFDDSVANDAFRVEDPTLEFDHKCALGLEVFGQGRGDGVIVQVHIGAALLAHGGFGPDGHGQFGAAFETGDELLFRSPVRGFRRGFEDFLDAKVLAATFTNCGKRFAGFRLLVAAMWACQQDLVL